MTTTIRLPQRVAQALASYCVETGRTKSEVIVELLEQRFLVTVAGASPYEAAQAAGFIGCVEGEANVVANAKKLVRQRIRARSSR